MDVTDDALKRLATRVRERRHELRFTQTQLAASSGTTDRLIRSIELGERRERHPATNRSIAQALRWTPDSIDRILDGKEPIEQAAAPAVSPTSNPVVDHALAEMRRRNEDLATRVERLEEWRDRVEAGEGQGEVSSPDSGWDEVAGDLKRARWDRLDQALGQGPEEPPGDADGLGESRRGA